MKFRISALAGAVALVASSASHALTFNFTFLTGTSVQAQQAFIDAGARWSSLFTDNVTLDMTVGQVALGAGILASAGSTRSLYTYSQFKTALTTDQSTANDTLAVSNLAAGPSFNMLLNRTSDNPNGAGSATAYLDNNGSANNTSIRVTNANAKALGLTPQFATTGNCTSACDASITFATGFTWDYNPNDGITAGAYDFVGIATHEIGHALGFISGVDILDINATGTFFSADQFTYVNSLDLFRYSAASVAAGLGTIDWTASTTAKYFSLDKGVTVGAGFSTGRTFGDGQQASHWKDSLGLGIMDPTAGTGELLAISANDRTALDVIGWNLAPIPEPQTYALLGMGLLGLAWRRRAMRND